MTKRYYMALALPLIAAIADIGAVTRHPGAVPGSSGGIPGPSGGAPGSSAKREIPSFSGATAWLNTQPLTPADLHGKVVLVEFWTYTCINWRRTLPYIRAWAARYKDKGLVVIGVSTQLNQWALDGDWTLREEAATLNKAGGWITYHFHARDVNLIMGPAKPGDPVRFRVLIDGHAPGAAHGIDVDEQGNGKCGEQGMYQLIRQPGPIINRDFTIEFLDPGVEAFDFTFG